MRFVECIPTSLRQPKEPEDLELAVVELHDEGWKYDEIQKMIEDQYGKKKVSRH